MVCKLLIFIDYYRDIYQWAADSVPKYQDHVTAQSQSTATPAHDQWSCAGVAVLREHCRALGLHSRGVRLPGLVHDWSTCREMTVHVLIIIRSRLMVSINIEKFTR